MHYNDYDDIPYCTDPDLSFLAVIMSFIRRSNNNAIDYQGSIFKSYPVFLVIAPAFSGIPFEFHSMI